MHVVQGFIPAEASCKTRCSALPDVIAGHWSMDNQSQLSEA
jgi:hypothetical protein